MSENTGTPEPQAETTSVFRADLLKEMENGTAAGSDASVAGAENLADGQALLVVKRSGTADPGKWWCYMRLGEWLRLTGAHLPLPDPSQPVCMSLASAAAVLRSAGYGTAPEGETL